MVAPVVVFIETVPPWVEVASYLLTLTIEPSTGSLSALPADAAPFNTLKLKGVSSTVVPESSIASGASLTELIVTLTVAVLVSPALSVIV
jgi:hypothetical protein